VFLAETDESGAVGEEQALEIERIKRRLDMLDHRLDSIDSMVTAVAERVMEQPLNFSLTCPHCGKNIEITILGSQKPTR
jgi:tRNA(Ser,Leu) C12 N-acetylase TAN1